MFAQTTTLVHDGYNSVVGYPVDITATYYNKNIIRCMF